MRILVVTQHFWPENFRINDIVEGFVQDGLSVEDRKSVGRERV